jgi:lipoate-protein ligase A
VNAWRFIDTGDLGGAANMAVDEALLACFDPETSRPVFRLYGWDPPALSLGRFQKACEVLDRQKCAAAGIIPVRRITGGGVIYHADEITYSLVCAPRHVPPASSIKESFRVLTSFLIRFYEGLGLVPSYAAEFRPILPGLGERSAYCFAGKETYDILIEGKKIGGNAQRRKKNVIFQHGSIPLANRAGFGAALLREPPPGIGETTCSLGELGAGAAREKLKKRMAESFAESMPADLREDSLTTEEKDVAASLALHKHAREEWVWEGIENRDNR